MGGCLATSSETATSNDKNVTLPNMPEIDLSACAAYWITSQASAEELKKAQRKLKKKKKYQKKSTYVLFRFLTKAVYSCKLPILNCYAQPMRRRGKFNNFLNKLKLALTSVCQTKEALKNPAQPTKPKTPAANHALFRLLCAQVDNCLRAQLQVMILNNGSEDGFAALICLRAMFADTDDMDYCQHAMNTLMTGQLKDSEHVFTFN